MKTRLLLAAAAAGLTLASSFAMASLFSWNDANRPPISLADALARAEKLLGDDAANRYCVSASLFGDENRESKEGAWNLFFAAADGSKKHVYINMQGTSDVKLWNGPIDWRKKEGRRTGLADVRGRIEELFAKEGIEAQFEADQEQLLVRHKTRDYQVYPELEDGGYADQLQAVPGPTADGIWLRVRLADTPDARRYGSDNGPYWNWVRGSYHLTEPGKFLWVDLREGRNVKYEVRNQLWRIFGEQTPR